MNNNKMSLEERVNDLEERIADIDAKENRRKIWSIIKTVIRVIIFALIIISIWRLYDYLSNLLQPIIKVAGNITNSAKGIDFSGLSNIINSFK